MQTASVKTQPSSNAPSAGRAQYGGPARVGAAQAAMQALLKFEHGLRQASQLDELATFFANEARRVTRARQVFVFRRGPRCGSLRLFAASAVSKIEANAPLTVLMERCVGGLAGDALKGATACDLDDVADESRDGGLARSYPLRKLLWVPFVSRDGIVVGGALLAREIEWGESDVVVASRIGGTAGHAWTALAPGDGRRVRTPMRRIMYAGAVVVLAACLLIPVPMSALAPFQIVPREPEIVAAPIEGVVKEVSVAPNEAVRKGDILIRFEDTVLRNKYDVAARELKVAEARLKRAAQLAFRDVNGRRELAIAAAERDVRRVERDFARDLLAKTVVRAERAGIAVYGDKKDLIGTPIKVGQRLLELAAPSKVFVRIEVPVADVALLQAGADVKLFLDSDPLRPVTAKLVRADYEAKAHTGSTVSFRAWARLEEGAGRETQTPRFGARGTAQIYGETVPLGLYLFRRPITAVRQWLGL